MARISLVAVACFLPGRAKDLSAHGVTVTRTLSLKDCINDICEAKVKHNFLKSKFIVVKIGEVI